MFTRHFFKVLFVFVGLIALALLGVFWTSQMEDSGPGSQRMVGPVQNVAN